MTILQPVQASRAIVFEGQEIYRINQPAVNNGDLFRLDQSVRAVVVGPESDFSEYTLWYFDPATNSRINLATISADQPWIGRIDARMTDEFPGTKTPGFIFIAPNEIYAPSQFDDAAIFPLGVVSNFAPQIDLLCYSIDPSQIPDKRPTRSRRLSVDVDDADPAAINVVRLPVYGRRHWDLTVVDNSFTLAGNLTLTLSVRGLRFGYPFSGSSARNPLIIDSASTTIITGPRQLGMSYDADAPSALAINGGRGYLDYLEIRITTDNPVKPNTGFGVRLWFDAKD